MYNSYRKRMESYIKKMKKQKHVWQPTQHNYENESTMTQKKIIKWNIYFVTIEKR